ncbi:MAG TPA: FAD-dependent oxidoreductase [Sphingobacterium sp.]|nr:FAD-dependent oxidoreductase [Sphingobacterium sp.]
MKYVYILALLLFYSYPQLLAKETKPSLLVYGAGIEAFTAAVQAARSNVPTLWVVNSDPSFHQQADTRIAIVANHHLDGGIWKELLMKTGSSEAFSDSVAIAVKSDLNVRLLVNAMEDMIKKENLLTIVKNNDVESLVRGRNTWQVTLHNKKRYDIRAIVDASLKGNLADKTKDKLTVPPVIPLKSIENLSVEQVRTTAAIAAFNQDCYVLTVRDIITQQANNIFFIRSFIPHTEDVEAIPLRAHIGQAVGASAAYCAFFKTTAEKIDVRKLQTELIGFRVRLLPWKNISQEDPNFASIQKAYLATIFGDSEVNKRTEFEKQDSVYADSVRAVFNQYYSRSQLWFLDNNVTYFSLRDLLSFVKVLAFRGDEVDSQVQKDWNRKLHFGGEYDPNHVVNRYEFATLIDRYASPFAKTVTLDGVILR